MFDAWLMQARAAWARAIALSLFVPFAIPIESHTVEATTLDDPSRPIMPDASGTSTARSVGEPQVIRVANGYKGTNPTGRRSLWCADFVNLVEQEIGRAGTGSRMARSFLDYGKRVEKPRAGDIVVLGRGGRSGHVGYFMEWEGERVVAISGNYGGRVAVGRFPKHRVVGFVRP